jgi:hypothetical protein
MGETCPLCGGALHAEQDWCLRCGGAARTRLAASPGWRAPLIGLAVAVVISLAVLGGAVIRLTEEEGSNGSANTVTSTTTTSAISALTPTTGTLSTSTVTPSTPAAGSGALDTAPGSKTTLSTPGTSGSGAATKP